MISAALKSSAAALPAARSGQTPPCSPSKEEPPLALLRDDAERHRGLGDPKEEEPLLARQLDDAERIQDRDGPEKQCRRLPCCLTMPCATALSATL